MFGGEEFYHLWEDLDTISKQVFDGIPTRADGASVF